jgi:hypothetical protein
LNFATASRNCHDKQFPLAFGADESDDRIHGYAVDDSGDIYVCGATMSDLWTDEDVEFAYPFMVKVSNDGHWRWGKYYKWDDADEDTGVTEYMTCAISDDSEYLMFVYEFDYPVVMTLDPSDGTIEGT